MDFGFMSGFVDLTNPAGEPQKAKVHLIVLAQGARLRIPASARMNLERTYKQATAENCICLDIKVR